MTKISNLKAKSIERTILYYNKFEYRIVLTSPHMFYSWNCKTIGDYILRIDEICEEYDKYSDNSSWASWRRPRPNVEIWEYDLIDNLLQLQQKYKGTKEFTIRRENQNCTIYTSNTAIIKEILSFYPQADISKVDLMPTGTLMFKKDPPAKYRAYTTNVKMSADFKTEMLEYLARTPDVKPSAAFYTYLHRANHRYASYLWDKYYIDYNDDKNLTMMMLMFPGMIGKKYKLEKK